MAVIPSIKISVHPTKTDIQIFIINCVLSTFLWLSLWFSLLVLRTHVAIKRIIVLFLFSVLFISTKHKGAPLYADAETAVYTRQALRSVVSLFSEYFYRRQVTELYIDEPQAILFASVAYARYNTLSMWVERIGVIEIDLDEFHLFIRHILRIDAGAKWWTANPWEMCGEWNSQQQAY